MQGIKKLNYYLKADSKNYLNQNKGFFRRIKNNFLSNPISDQKYIWKYIKNLRYLEYHINTKGIHHKLLKIVYLSKLKKIAYKTGFQIPPFTCREGLTIWHWGSIIINPIARIGKNCVLNPGIVIGHKNPGENAPIIGDGVFIGAGAKIIGSIKIGNNVTIAPNAVVVSDVPDNFVVGGIPAQKIRSKPKEI